VRIAWALLAKKEIYRVLADMVFTRIEKHELIRKL
jgi:hypothetical protein